MLTIGALPKPFVGHIGVIQRNAIMSWRQLAPDVQIILCGNELGVAEIAAEFGLEHVPDIARNSHGTPQLNAVFVELQQRARFRCICYANADVILLSDWARAMGVLVAAGRPFLAVGECWNLALTDALAWSQVTDTQLRQQVHNRGVRRGKTAIDYFCFNKELFSTVAPLALGRAYFDNYLLAQALRQHAALVDCTSETLVIHQNHDYAHIRGGFLETRFGTEAQENLRLAGGYLRLATLHDCTHTLQNGVLRRSWAGTLHLMRPYVYGRGAIRTMYLMLLRWLRR